VTLTSDIFVLCGEIPEPSLRTVETVERKGVGHPDSMADLLAETFCYRYARHCLEAFGFVPNHSADKTTLVGADATVRLGGYTINEPIHAYLFGKVTRAVGGVSIPVEEMFAEAAGDVLVASTRYPRVAEHVLPHVQTVVGNPIDHHPGYYNPESRDQLRSIITTERLSNDTVACAGSARRTPVETLVFELEQFVQGPGLTARVAGTGSDVKVLATRVDQRVDVTVCIPFHPEAVTAWDDYDRYLDTVRSVVLEYLDAHAGKYDIRLHLNQRDVPGRGYLAPFGTCLGKGDSGAVGRGNRYNGLISLSRPTAVEAPAGKNLMHHTGKIYSILSQRIADDIAERFDLDSEVTITARVGARLDEPAGVFVNLMAKAAPVEEIRDVIRAHIHDIDAVTNSLLAQDPVSTMASNQTSPAGAARS
jgi:S-adenosylmethionine synthetase